MRGAVLALMLIAGPAWAGTATTAQFGIAADGRRVDLITLANGRGMTVRVSTRGGAITAIETPDRGGRIASVVLGRPDFAAWEKAGSFNTVVGRYANRIGGGGFTLDGKRYDLAGANAAGVTLHGGPGGFASKTWRARTFADAANAGVVFSLTSPDGENGYPGELTVEMTYTLTAANLLRLEYRATTTKPTVVNLTNHSYFNLSGGGVRPVVDELLTIYASRYTPTDRTQIPTGQLAPVAGTSFDFRRPTRIGERVAATDPQLLLARGIDHNFVLDQPGAAHALTLAARLSDPGSGRALEVRTTEPGMQVYTGNHLDGTIVGAAGRTLRQSDGICFETQHFPDSPNRSDFPSTVLRPGETYRSTTEFAFSTER